MTTPYEPAQNQPPAGQQPIPPAAHFPPPAGVPLPPSPAGQFPAPPAGQFSAPPAGQFPAPSVAKKRRSWLLPALLGVGAFVVLCCGGSMVLSLTGDDKTTEGSSVSGSAAPAEKKAEKAAEPAEKEAEPEKKTADPEPTKAKTAGIGDKVRGGDFEFTVKSVKCGISRVGSDYLNAKAQGEFCRVSLTIKNVTKRAHTFHADGTLTAQDGDGRKYEVDGAAGIYGNSDGQGFLDEINPGNSVTANVYFDVPKGTKLKTITFDAGLFTFAEDAVVTL